MKLFKSFLICIFFQAQVSDSDHPEWHCTLTATVIVSDVNDNAPEFELHQYTVTAAENSPVNSVVAKVTARDPDLGEHFS